MRKAIDREPESRDDEDTEGFRCGMGRGCDEVDVDATADARGGGGGGKLSV